MLALEHMEKCYLKYLKSIPYVDDKSSRYGLHRKPFVILPDL